MKKLTCQLALSGLMILFFSESYSQSKAQIHIRKNQNGVQSDETKEIILKDGQKIEDILIEMGVLDELGQLQLGQELEIRIDKSEGLENLQNLELHLPPLPPLPEFAPAPPMENRPFLGVMLMENSETDNDKNKSSGAVVSEVIAGSAAEKAGLLSGDIIFEIDGEKIDGINGVIDYIQTREIGDKVEVLVSRGGKNKKIKATLGEKAMELNSMEMDSDELELQLRKSLPNLNFRFGPDSITIFCPSSPNCIIPNDSMRIGQPFSWNNEGMDLQETAFLGVTPADEEVEQGVKVNVEPETSAEKMGLENGDIIVSINGIKVNDFDALSEIISKVKPGEIVNLTILREGRQKNISGEIGKRSVSGFDDFRIFHDFKGMDEGGNYFYDYEFDMDEQDIEQRMQELLGELDRKQSLLDEERSRVESELDKLHQSETVIIKIQIADLTQEEVNQVNKNASTKLALNNDLLLEQISFFPNPNDGLLNLNFVTLEKKPVKLVLYSNDGEIVYLEERSSFDGTYNKTIDISNEPNGTYFLQILQNGKSYSKKIVKGM